MTRDAENDTTLSSRPVPPTELDVRVPPTRLDSAIPATGLDAQLPPTGLDARGAADAAQDSIHRFDLPAKLRETHELLGPPLTDDPRSVGGEAALSRVREKDGGEIQVYKIYFRASSRDEEVWTRLGEADRKDIHGHVVDIFDYGISSGLWWELMEFCELGSLSDLIDEEGPKLNSDRIREIIVEITDALEFLHGLSIEHADLKPQNILVRSLDPLDLVLTDFGLSRALKQTREARSLIGMSYLYAPPQAFWRETSIGQDGKKSSRGFVSVAFDWWALGMIVGEMALGRHPLAFEDGTLQDQLSAGDEILSRSIDFSAVEDLRLRSLCEGLTRRDDRPRHRWGLKEVRAWLAGEDPKVAAQDSERSPARRVASPFPFQDPETKATRAYTDPVELAAAMANGWSAACEILGGTSAHRAEQRALRSFLQSLHLGDAVQLLAEQGDVEYRLSQLLVELDPSIAPSFRGYALDRDGLLGLARAQGDAASDALRALFSERILLNYSRSPEHAHLAELDAAWHQEMARFSEMIARAGATIGAAERTAAAAEAIGTILIALLDPSARDDLHARAAAAAADKDARRQAWFAEIADQPAV